MINDVGSVEEQIDLYALQNGRMNFLRQAFSLWLQVKFVLQKKGFTLQRILANLPKIVPVLFSGMPLPKIISKCVSIIRHKHRRCRKGRWS